MCSAKIMLCMALLAAAAIATISADTGKFSTCCTKVSSAKPRVHIEDFLIQKADPPCVDAVMFITKEGKILCSKPNVPWVTKKVKEIRLRKEAPETTETSQKNSTTPIPTVRI
ncbi:C-C motif chemokine 3-like [Hyperolius riggenbachi]|uniref:C-C motif chemokine 3-like n=1 Tax=Hyperolius riggenbachi TaxID=752182 RepID=UPI0035A2F512